MVWVDIIYKATSDKYFYFYMCDCVEEKKYEYSIRHTKYEYLSQSMQYE